MLSFSNEVDPFFSAAHIYFSNTYQLLKRSTLQRVVVVHKSYGWKSFFMIMGSLKTPCVSSVKIQVPLIYPRILFNTQSQSISKFDIISFETWWKRKLYGWSLSTPKMKRRIFSLNLLMILSLNIFLRPSVLVSFFDSYLLCDPLLIIGAECSNSV